METWCPMPPNPDASAGRVSRRPAAGRYAMVCRCFGRPVRTSQPSSVTIGEVLDPDADRAGHVDARLDGHDLAGGQRRVRALRQPRALVDLGADAVAEAVAEVLAVAGGGDDLARDGVDLAPAGAGAHRGQRGLLSAEHQLVDLAVARVELAGRVGARAVRGVAVELGAPVDRDQRAGRDRDVARDGVRQRAVLAGGDDRRERRGLGAGLAHRDLEVERDVALGAADQAAAQDLGQRGVGELRRGADLVELAGVLDRAQLLDERRRRRRARRPRPGARPACRGP